MLDPVINTGDIALAIAYPDRQDVDIQVIGDQDITLLPIDDLQIDISKEGSAELIVLKDESNFTIDIMLAGANTIDVVAAGTIIYLPKDEYLPLVKDYLEHPNDLTDIYIGDQSLSEFIQEMIDNSTTGGGGFVDVNGWFELVNPGQANEYLRCKKPLAGDYDIQAFSANGLALGSIIDNLPVASDTMYGLVKYDPTMFETVDGVLRIREDYAGGGGGVPGAGMVNQVALWTASESLYGSTGLTYDGSALRIIGNVYATGEVAAFGSGGGTGGTGEGFDPDADYTVTGQWEFTHTPTVGGSALALASSVSSLAATVATDAELAAAVSALTSAYQAADSTLNTAIGTKLNSSSYTAADVLTKLLTVDGSGSGIDADLLDGQHGAYYAPLASPKFTGTVLIGYTSDPGSGNTLAVNGKAYFNGNVLSTGDIIAYSA